MEVEKVEDAFANLVWLSLWWNRCIACKKWWNWFDLIIIGWQNENENEEWKKKPTVQARKGFIGEWCGSDLEVMKRPRHSQHWSQDEVDNDGKDEWSCFNCDDVKKDLLFFLFRSKEKSIQATQNDGIDGWQIFPLHHPVLPANWCAEPRR